MTIARKHIVNEDFERVYHCTSRCVRRAFLLGQDDHSGHSFNHRRGWLRDRMEILSGCFAIDILGYALMENHAHCICRTRPDMRDGWSNEEVVRRWKRVYPGKRQLDGEAVEPAPEVVAALATDGKCVAKWRRRLGKLGEYMKALKEPIARRANREDGCTGHFWEGRYKAKPLLDDAAVLAGMIYVDLNPIRAGLARTPEESDFTSAKERIDMLRERRALEARLAEARNRAGDPRPLGQALVDPALREMQRLMDTRRGRDGKAWLTPMRRLPEGSGAGEGTRGAGHGFEDRGNESIEGGCLRATCSAGGKGALPMTDGEYFVVLDWTGRQLRAGKRGVIPSDVAPILERLDIEASRWVETVSGFGRLFRRVAGTAESMAQAARRLGCRWFQGMHAAARAFRSSSSSSDTS